VSSSPKPKMQPELNESLYRCMLSPRLPLRKSRQSKTSSFSSHVRHKQKRALAREESRELRTVARLRVMAHRFRPVSFSSFKSAILH
jgi:hypothetical protein